ncbi:MAG TPA: hypothetical protein VLI39_09675 [Sedimentisphaerales bacterium]|nr:hypothetical protein [Sedimentisphaerales bacterium]
MSTVYVGFTLSHESVSNGDSFTVDGARANFVVLRFNRPDVVPTFPGKFIFIRQTYPTVSDVYDVKQVISEGGRIQIADVEGTYQSGAVYARFEITFAAEPPPPPPPPGPIVDPPTPPPVIPPVDPLNPPVELPEPVDPSKMTVGPGKPSKNVINVYPNWHGVDPMTTTNANNTLFIYHLVEGYSNNPAEPPRAAAILIRSSGLSSTPLSDGTDRTVDPIVFIDQGGERSLIAGGAKDRSEGYLVRTQFDSCLGDPVQVEPGMRNQVAFAYPIATLEGSRIRFFGKSPVVMFDIPNSPAWSVDDLIRRNEGVLELERTKEQYAARSEDTASLKVILVDNIDIWFCDLNGDGTVNSMDARVARGRSGFKGPNRADVASPLYEEQLEDGSLVQRGGERIPDGVVDQHDIHYVTRIGDAMEAANKPKK